MINKKSIYKGVTWHNPYSKWVVYVYNNNKRHFIGYFIDEIEAAYAYDINAIKIKGIKAKTNFNKDNQNCVICGDKSEYFYKNQSFLCKKHISQMNQHGQILERTKFDVNEVCIYDDCAEIVLYDKTNKECARTIIDINFIAIAKKYKWCLKDNGYVFTSNYNGKGVYLHRIILSHDVKTEIDHIDRNKLNNRSANLREAYRFENASNRDILKLNTSGVVGVELIKSTGKWKASITFHKKRIHLGVFKNKEDAIKIRKEAEEKYFGEYRKDANDENTIT